MHYDLYSFTSCEQHIVPRRIIPSCILYYDVLEAICSIDVGHSSGGLWGMSHDSWCAPLAPNFTLKFPCCRMIVATNKWLEGHLLFFVLRQAGDALRWFHMWDYDPPPDCHMKTCFYLFLLPYIDDVLILMGESS